MSEEERLAIIETKLDGLIEQINNHLKHHFWTNIALLSIIGSLVIALIIK